MFPLLQSFFCALFRVKQYFKDDLIECCVRMNLDYTDESVIPETYLMAMTEFSCGDSEDNEPHISSLNEIVVLKNLETLYLYRIEVDYSPIIELTNLQELTIKHTNIVDFSFISELKNLEHLDLEDNQLEDISFITNLSKINSVIVMHNSIEDISYFAANFECQDHIPLNFAYNLLDDGDASDIQLLRDKGCVLLWDGDGP